MTLFAGVSGNRKGDAIWTRFTANSQLLADLSPGGLRKRMQGKSCFNFTAVDEPLLAELAELTAVAFQDYQRQGYV
jgi:hypothetical protein